VEGSSRPTDFPPANGSAVARSLALGVPGIALGALGIELGGPIILVLAGLAYLLLAAATRQLHLLIHPPRMHLEGHLLELEIPDYGLLGMLRPWHRYEQHRIDLTSLSSLVLETSGNLFGGQKTLVLGPSLSAVRVEYNWFDIDLERVQAALLDALDAQHRDLLPLPDERVGPKVFFPEPLLLEPMDWPRWWPGILLFISVMLAGIWFTGVPAFIAIGCLSAAPLGMIGWANFETRKRTAQNPLRLTSEGVQLGTRPIVRWEDIASVRAKRVSTRQSGWVGKPQTAHLDLKLRSGAQLRLHNDYAIGLDALYDLLQNGLSA